MIVFAGSRLKGTDSEGNTQSIRVVGAESDTLKVADFSTNTLLHNILKELRLLNLHMENITELRLGKEDMEDI